MKAVKVLRSVCMLAVACGLVAANGAAAQVRDKKPASQQVHKAAKPAVAAGKKDKVATRKAPVRTSTAANKKTPTTAKGPSRSPVKAAGAKGGTPPAVAKRSQQQAPSAKRSQQQPNVAARAQRPALPPPVAWVPPPLGPERFYPNGIPELRPEFMHPERPPQPADRSANVTPALGGHPELMP